MSNLTVRKNRILMKTMCNCIVRTIQLAISKRFTNLNQNLLQLACCINAIIDGLKSNFQ